MKLTTSIILLLLLIIHIESKPSVYIVDALINKTSDVKHYVKDTSSSIYHYVNRKQKSWTDKFQMLIDKAKHRGRSLIETLRTSNNTRCPESYVYEKFSSPQLIAANGYPSESHTITTEDGYILTIHRIPYSKYSLTKEIPVKTVLLQHGVLGSSADWLITGPEKGLAYILSNQGYDVWLSNARGNTYSKAHINRSYDTFEFWNFTFHEISQYDIPAVIDYITDLKGEDNKINYIGHSMGTTVLFAMLSTRVEYNKKLRAGFALAPIGYMSEIRSPIRLLAPFANNIEYLLELIGANEFLPRNAILEWLSEHMCEINHYEEAICENSMFVLCGHDERQFNRTLLPMILSHTPAGASTKTLVHYAQEIHSGGDFQYFDYGKKLNMEYYGIETPPKYDISKITLPIAFLSANNDWLAGEGDVKRLYSELSNPIEHYIVPFKEFNHLDFLIAVDAPKLVYKKLIQLLENGHQSDLMNIDNE